MKINIDILEAVERYYYDTDSWFVQCGDYSYAIHNSELDVVRENNCFIAVLPSGDYLLLTDKQVDELVKD